MANQMAQNFPKYARSKQGCFKVGLHEYVVVKKTPVLRHLNSSYSTQKYFLNLSKLLKCEWSVFHTGSVFIFHAKQPQCSNMCCFRTIKCANIFVSRVAEIIGIVEILRQAILATKCSLPQK